MNIDITAMHRIFKRVPSTVLKLHECNFYWVHVLHVPCSYNEIFPNCIVEKRPQLWFEINRPLFLGWEDGGRGGAWGDMICDCLWFRSFPNLKCLPRQQDWFDSFLHFCPIILDSFINSMTIPFKNIMPFIIFPILRQRLTTVLPWYYYLKNNSSVSCEKRKL